MTEFVRKHGGKMSSHLVYAHSDREVPLVGGVATCLRCGHKNRMRRGPEGARCGSCGQSLSEIFN